GRALTKAFAEVSTPNIMIKDFYATPAYKTAGLLYALRERTLEQARTGRGKDRGLLEGLALGSPEQVISTIRKWESAGVDGLIFFVNQREILPQEQVLESMRLFAREVMPAFSEPATDATPELVSR